MLVKVLVLVLWLVLGFLLKMYEEDTLVYVCNGLLKEIIINGYWDVDL